MTVVIRTHCKNEERFQLLKNTVESVLKLKYSFDGEDELELMILDDQSPEDFAVKIFTYCYDKSISYRISGFTPCTKNGLYWSFYYAIQSPDDIDSAMICLTDDCDIAPGFETLLLKSFDMMTMNPDYWLTSFFAPYPMQARKVRMIPNSLFWDYPAESFYAGIACIYSPQLINLYMRKWERVMKGEEEKEAYQDDLTIKHLIMQNGKKIINSFVDFAQHTGQNQRAFGDNLNEPSSNYRSPFFIRDLTEGKVF